VPGQRSDKWQKQKTQRSDDFLVGGYIPGRYGVEQLVVGEKRHGDLYFVDSVKNGFVPSTRQRVFDVIKGKEIEKCPFVNLPEKKGRYRMDRKKWLRCDGYNRELLPKSRLTSEQTPSICATQNFFGCATLRTCAG
jgi:ATP-dependent DNA ligase